MERRSPVVTVGGKNLRCCVCTSHRADAEPRAPRHATALASLDPGVEVIFIDSVPLGMKTPTLNALNEVKNVIRKTNFYPHRGAGLFQLVVRRIRQKLARWRFRVSGHLSPMAVSASTIGLERLLAATGANIFFAHSIDTLLASYRVARRIGASVVFDSMEFHSDMGDSQTDCDRAMTRAIESLCLPQCALVFAASEQIAEELEKFYGIPRPIALYNVPPRMETLPATQKSGFQLYWRNTVIGLGQRGLEDALVALAKLPADITLHLQGRSPKDGGRELMRRIDALGLTERVILHGPYAPDDAIKEAAQHTVGLCLERRGPRNHELTVSNKLFDYHMAGLVTVASNLPGLRAVLEKSQGGMTFEPGSVDDLAKVIATLYHDRELAKTLSANARAFALSEGNSEHEMTKFRDAFLRVYDPEKPS